MLDIQERVDCCKAGYFDTNKDPAMRKRRSGGRSMGARMDAIED